MDDMEQLALDHRKQDKLARAVLIMSAASVALMAVIAFLGLPRIFSTDAASSAVRRNSDLLACRASYSAAVTGSNIDVQLLILDGLVAVADGDDDALQAIVTPSVNGGSSRAKLAADLLRDRTDAYRQAIDESRTDPDGFLRRCHQEAP